MTDLIAGHVDVLIASAPSMLQQVKSGKVRGLGVTTLKASPIAPGLPALAGAGAPGYEVELWWGVLTTAGTPKDVVAKLNAEINRSLAAEEMRGFLLNEGAEPAPDDRLKRSAASSGATSSAGRRSRRPPTSGRTC